MPDLEKTPFQVPAEVGAVADSGNVPIALGNDDQAGWLTEMMARLKELELLSAGWDGYQAPPPGALAISTAMVFLRGLHRVGFQPNRVAASVVGGIGITLRKNSKKSYVEFYNDGAVYSVLSASEMESVVQQVTDDPDFSRLVASIRMHLDG